MLLFEIIFHELHEMERFFISFPLLENASTRDHNKIFEKDLKLNYGYRFHILFIPTIRVYLATFQADLLPETIFPCGRKWEGKLRIRVQIPELKNYDNR